MHIYDIYKYMYYISFIVKLKSSTSPESLEYNPQSAIAGIIPGYRFEARRPLSVPSADDWLFFCKNEEATGCIYQNLNFTFCVP